MDTEMLINEVCKRRLLWDKRSKQHHNRFMLQKAWTEIAFFMDCSIKEARCKWKNLKDHFRKEYRKEQENRIPGAPIDPDAAVTWSHYKSLLFLKDQFVPTTVTEVTASQIKLEKCEEIEHEVVEPSGGTSKIDDAISPSQGVTREGDIADMEVMNARKENLDSVTKGEEAFRNVKIKTLMKAHAKSSNSWGPPKKRSRTHNDSSADAIPNDESKTEGKVVKGNENYHFVMTLLPHLDRLSPSKRLAVQIKIQQAVFSAIYGSNRSSSETTTSYDSTSSF